MKILSSIMILCGIVLQLWNFVSIIRFIHKNKNAVTDAKTRLAALDYVVCALILLFCIVYIIIFFLRFDSIWIGVILLSGAIFVTIVLQWIFRLTESSKKSTIAISETLIGIIEARDPNLNGHSLHVRELSKLIYKYLPQNLKKEINAENLEYAALFHDVGKLGVPESILNKPARLSDEEWRVMKTHPEISVQILKPLESFDFISKWILYHHERIDGKGYYNIPEKDIPLPARIISVADTYSAIAMVRSYKPAKSYEEAVTIMRSVAGTQLDEFLVDLFCRIPKEEVVQCQERVTQKLK